MKAKHNPEIVKAIAASLVGIETGNGTSEGDVFNATLPEGLTPDTVEAVNNHVTTFVASGMEAVGNAALAAMKKDKKLDIVNANIGLGAFGSADYGVHRNKEITIPPAEKGGTPEKGFQPGASSVKVTFQAGKNSGLLGKARTAIKEQAAEQFGVKK